jgi:hypothetical protein
VCSPFVRPHDRCPSSVAPRTVGSMTNNPGNEAAKVLRAERLAMRRAFLGGQALRVFSAAVITLEPGARERAERLAPDAKRALVAEAVNDVMDLGIQTQYTGAAENRVHTAVRRLVAVRQLQELVDAGALAVRAELASGAVEFALRLVIDLLTHTGASVRSGVPKLQPPASTGQREFDTLLLSGIRCALGAEGAEESLWPAPPPLPLAWIVYGFRPMSPAWRELTPRETPEELARANVFIRERSLRSV